MRRRGGGIDAWQRISAWRCSTDRQPLIGSAPQSDFRSLQGPLFCADRKGGKSGQRALRPLKTPLYSRICAHRPALLQPSNFNRMAYAMLVPTAGQIALSTNWPSCIAAPVSFGAAAYPLASTFCGCAPFNVQCAIFRFSTAPAPQGDFLRWCFAPPSQRSRHEEAEAVRPAHAASD